MRKRDRSVQRNPGGPSEFYVVRKNPKHPWQPWRDNCIPVLELNTWIKTMMLFVENMDGEVIGEFDWMMVQAVLKNVDGWKVRNQTALVAELLT